MGQALNAIKAGLDLVYVLICKNSNMLHKLVELLKLFWQELSKNEKNLKQFDIFL